MSFQIQVIKARCPLSRDALIYQLQIIITPQYLVVGNREMASKKSHQRVQSDTAQRDNLIYYLAPTLLFPLFLSSCFVIKAISFASLLVSGVLGHPSLRLCKSSKL